MRDDIVKRLRGQRTNRVLCEEAADEIERLRASVINTFENSFDEIERLRAERNRWAHEAEYWHAVADRCDTGCNCLQMDGQ